MIAKRIFWASVISGLLVVPVIAQSTNKTADVRESAVPVFALNDVDSLWIRWAGWSRPSGRVRPKSSEAHNRKDLKVRGT